LARGEWIPRARAAATPGGVRSAAECRMSWSRVHGLSRVRPTGFRNLKLFRGHAIKGPISAPRRAPKKPCVFRYAVQRSRNSSVIADWCLIPGRRRNGPSDCGVKPTFFGKESDKSSDARSHCSCRNARDSPSGMPVEHAENESLAQSPTPFIMRPRRSLGRPILVQNRCRLARRLRQAP
jgi:hypothetical protein